MNCANRSSFDLGQTDLILTKPFLKPNALRLVPPAAALLPHPNPIHPNNPTPLHKKKTLPFLRVKLPLLQAPLMSFSRRLPAPSTTTPTGKLHSMRLVPLPRELRTQLLVFLSVALLALARAVVDRLARDARLEHRVILRVRGCLGLAAGRALWWLLLCGGGLGWLGL